MSNLKKDEFTIDFYQRIDLSGYVVFIENDSQVEVIDYIKSNYNSIQESFKTEGKRFILLSEIYNTESILKPFRYHYPRLTLDDVWRSPNFETLKSYLGYKGNITTGLLSIDTRLGSQFIEFESTSISDFKNLTEEYLSDYKKRITRYWNQTDMMLSCEDYSDEDIKLDDETKKRVDSILEQFETIKDKGNLLQILPIVEGYLKSQYSAYLDELSTLKIDSNFNLFLRDYNLEIKLSHFTKSIYLLFLNHPEGILLSELHLHKNELLTNYKSVSNRLDLDKMNDSIDDLTDPKSNAIYVHLSRIKSAFTKVVHLNIAQHYFIDGGKNKPKKIDLKSDLIIWQNQVVKITNTSDSKDLMDAFLNTNDDE